MAWQALKPQVLGAIMEHFVADRPVIEGQGDAADEDVDPADAEIVAQIKELIDTRVRPAVAGDGGDIVFRGFRDGVVRLQMQGACSGCPSSTATLKHGIENMLRHYVPEVKAVEQVASDRPLHGGIRDPSRPSLFDIERTRGGHHAA